MKAGQIARFGLLTAMALVLGYVENLAPVAPGLPGVKLGLANTALLFALYLMGERQAALMMVLKVLLSALLFAGPFALLYSLAGGVLSLVGMVVIKKITGVSIVGVSVCGAVLHNVGQLAAACLALGSLAALSYLPILLLSAIITGMLTGLVARAVCKAFKSKGLDDTENK